MRVYARDAFKIADRLATDQAFWVSHEKRHNNAVYIQHKDGTSLFWFCAFAVRFCDFLLIFTEHHGHHVYDISSDGEGGDLYFWMEWEQQNNIPDVSEPNWTRICSNCKHEAEPSKDDYFLCNPCLQKFDEENK